MRDKVFAILLLVGTGGVQWAAASRDRELSENAHRLANQFAATLRFFKPISVSLESSMPKPRMDAHTSRNMMGGCTIRILREVADEEGVVAHEVCHCVLDYGDLSLWGYQTWVRPEEVIRLEKRAQSCESWLTSRDIEVDLDRRAGRLPAEWGRVLERAEGGK